jgi:8-oxo-dGTP diphosphatase
MCPGTEGERAERVSRSALPQRQRVAAYAVIVRGGEVLLSRLAPYLSETERWTLPGGGIDFGEVDGSTVDAAWHPLTAVLAGQVETVPMVRLALSHHRTARRQRLAAKALVVRDDRVLLTRNSPSGPHPGVWTLPGGGVEHGEPPAETVAREVREETGLEAVVGELLGVHDEHFTGTAPTGLEEDFHGIDLVFVASVSAGEPAVGEVGGTADQAAWVPLDGVRGGGTPVSSVVTAALGMGPHS